MKLPRQVTTALLLVFAGALSAAEEYQDTIPIDLARALMGGGGVDPMMEVRFFRDWPADFPNVRLPEDISLLGAMQRGNYQQQLVLQSDLAPGDARETVIRAFEDSGWLLLPSPMDERTQRGFVSASPPALPRQVCHDDHGTLQVQSRSREAGSVVTLQLVPVPAMGAGRTSFDCASYGDRAAGGMGPMGRQMGGLREHLPRLVLPESQGPRMAPFGSGFSGSTNSLRTEAQVRNEWDIDQVRTHFKAQLEEQGWARENEWSGRYTAGGSWTRSPESDLRLVGILQVVDTGEDAFDVIFRMLAPERVGANAVGAGRAFISPGP